MRINYKMDTVITVKNNLYKYNKWCGDEARAIQLSRLSMEPQAWDAPGTPQPAWANQHPPQQLRHSVLQPNRLLPYPQAHVHRPGQKNKPIQLSEHKPNFRSQSRGTPQLLCSPTQQQCCPNLSQTQQLSKQQRRAGGGRQRRRVWGGAGLVPINDYHDQVAANLQSTRELNQLKAALQVRALLPRCPLSVVRRRPKRRPKMAGAYHRPRCKCTG